jgi:hypothetical protein
MAKKRWTNLLGWLVLASVILGACAPGQDPRVVELESALATAQAAGQTSEQIAELQQQLEEAQAASEPAYGFCVLRDTFTVLWIGERSRWRPSYDSPGINVARHVTTGSCSEGLSGR